VPLTEEALASQDCVLLVTDHDYDLGLVLRASRLVIDTRNAIECDAPNYVGMWRRNGNHVVASSRPAVDSDDGHDDESRTAFKQQVLSFHTDGTGEP